MRGLVLRVGLLALVFTAGLYAETIRVQWDRGADFEKYQSFAWGEGQPIPDEGNHELLRDSVRDALGVAGIFEDDTQPDLIVAYYASAKEAFEIKGGYRASWQDEEALTVDTERAGTLVVDLVDASTNQLIWRATATAIIDRNPKRNRKAILDAVAKMFADFPPTKP